MCVSVWLPRRSLGTCSKCVPLCNSIGCRDAEREKRSVLVELRPELNVSVATNTPLGPTATGDLLVFKTTHDYIYFNK